MTREKLVDVVSKFREANNNLIIACLILEGVDGFDNTVDEIKKTIGDVTCSERLIDDAIQKIDFPK